MKTIKTLSLQLCLFSILPFSAVLLYFALKDAGLGVDQQLLQNLQLLRVQLTVLEIFSVVLFSVIIYLLTAMVYDVIIWLFTKKNNCREIYLSVLFSLSLTNLLGLWLLDFSMVTNLPVFLAFSNTLFVVAIYSLLTSGKNLKGSGLVAFVALITNVFPVTCCLVN